MKYKVLGFLTVILFVCALLSYHESVVIMRGDYLLTRWVGVTETNKNWLMLFFWIVVGGTTPYILWKGPKVLKKRKLDKGEK
jgi:hypothetical protein